MITRKNEVLVILILWKEILAIPTYTILFNYNIKLFWILLIIGRIVNLIIVSRNIDLNEILDDYFEKNEKKNKNLNHIVKLSLFTMISTPTLYILTLINNKSLFMILITVEISDYIVYKLLDENLSSNMKKYFKKLNIKKIKSKK